MSSMPATHTQQRNLLSENDVRFKNPPHEFLNEQQSDENKLTTVKIIQEDAIGEQFVSLSLTSLIDNGNKLADSVADAKFCIYKGKKIAGFELQGIEMICLPQAYETFLKEVIGGLHTVYTKLKRLQIRPVVCNVEQVRALRSLGAIQKGVNRCKLISIDDFDRLYDDCYKIYPRPGRPAKRSMETNWEESLSGGDKTRKRYFNAEQSQWIYQQFNAPLQSNNNNENNTTSYCDSHQQLADSKAEKMKTYETVVPSYSAQQLIVQHMMVAASAAATSQQVCSNDNKITTMDSIQEFRENSEGRSLSPLAPLNLTKNGNLSPSESDNDAPYQHNATCRFENIHQNNQSNQNLCTEDEQALQCVIRKLITLIEAATMNFKAELELIEHEKSFVLRLQTELEHKRSEYERTRCKLFKEQKKAKIYFQRYCKAKREWLDLKEKMINNTQGDN